MAVTPSSGLITAPYSVPNVLFARITTNNTAIATSFTGGTESSTIEDVITAPFLATGKISTFASSTTVTGTETDFVQQFETGQYLYYFDALGNPNLLGEIDAIVSPTQIVLKDDALSVVTLKSAGSNRTKLSGGESFYMRIPAVVKSYSVYNPSAISQIYAPNMNEWRINNFTNPTAYNNPGVCKLTRYSNPGDVVSIDTTSSASAKDVPFTIVCKTLFKGSQIGSNTIINNSTQFPNYIWFELNPYGGSGTNLIQKTMYNLYAKTNYLSGAVFKIEMPIDDFLGYGYSTSNIKV